MNKVRLGKRKHKILRFDKDSNGVWKDGEFIPADRKLVEVFANVQPSFSSPMTLLLSEGDRTREMVWFSSDHHIYSSQSGGTNDETIESLKEADRLCYRGCLWLVKVSRPFSNFGEHCECIAVKINESIPDYIEGLVDVRQQSC